MALWEELRRVFDGAFPAADGSWLDRQLLDDVSALSRRTGRTPEEMVLILISQAVCARRQEDRAHRSWNALSPREKQVAALVCTGLTNRQIAARLVISPETVKTHVRHILRKFSISSRIDLRRLLAGRDLS